MSDIEEPPAKMSKYTDLQYLEEEELDSIEENLDDGQEEWLSEEVLTDDDGLPVTQAQSSQDTNDETSQPESTHTQKQTAPTHASITITPTPTSLTMTPTNSYSLTITGPTKVPLEGIISETTIPAALNSYKSTTNPPTISIVPMVKKIEDKSGDQNIEDTLNELVDPKKEMLDDLDKFLIRKTDGKVLEAKLKQEDAKVMSEDNGNDTDDLLRMLGENGDTIKKKNIKLTKKSKHAKDDASTDDDDDDDFVYERNKMKSFNMAKSLLAKEKPASKADPENSSLDDDVTDASSDEAETMGKMFKMSSAGHKRPTQPKKPAVVKKIVRMNSAQKTGNPNAAKPKPQSNDTNKKSILKPLVQRKPDAPTRKPDAAEVKVKVKTPAPFKPFQPNLKSGASKNVTWKSDETIDEEEYLEDDDGYELDEEEFLEDSDEDAKRRIPIRRPEQMDEEWPSDAESPSEGGSLYDELPSSDSEDIGNWFSLDIRGERAAEYLPLLGSKAYELLTEEQSQVSNRVSLLRNSLSALTRSAQRQHDELRAAAMALAEVDDTLRAT